MKKIFVFFKKILSFFYLKNKKEKIKEKKYTIFPELELWEKEKNKKFW